MAPKRRRSDHREQRHSIIDLDGAAVDGVGNEVTVLAIQTVSGSDFIFA